MAELARDFYESLQNEGLVSYTERQTATKEVLNAIQTQLSPENKHELEKNLSSDNVSEVIDLLPNGKASGTNGLPYEFWKWVNNKSKSLSEKDQDEEPFNFIDCLTAVLNDVEIHGAAPNTCFADGLLH
ncbi:hypothetical protein DFJ58DRAFT_615399, partial [Suillus subalutaceus]|uniref:uncharacterized protein n=1 Tax=Suillus subalutaceus TaxID=48586 RepID=UPI001B87142D